MSLRSTRRFACGYAAGAGDRFNFDLPGDGAESMSPCSPPSRPARRTWQAVVVTPTDDFVGDLKRTNRLLIWGASLLVLLEGAIQLI